MNIIFLDFDGVLNNLQSKEIFDLKNMNIFSKLINKCPKNTKIILSTSHRYNSIILSKFIKYCEIVKIDTQLIIGTTPNFHRGVYKRHLEIKDWLSKTQNVNKWIVLDDFEVDVENLIKTDMKTGLTEHNIDKALEIFYK